ncbi:MAG: hypothetical protein F6K10_31055 [Moorea sp. SIO2B7]|nr:hypothetical protein [Moorena sp. SIO2B7]
MGIFSYLIAAFLIFIALEELSWGQRFIPVKSPEFFEQYNSKAELSLHNFVGLEQYLYYGFMLLGLLGGLSWYFSKIIIRKPEKYHFYVRYLLPSWFLSSFFLIVFIYFFILQYIPSSAMLLEPFKESMELLLSLAFFIFVITNFFRQSFDFDKLTSMSKART